MMNGVFYRCARARAGARASSPIQAVGRLTSHLQLVVTPYPAPKPAGTPSLVYAKLRAPDGGVRIGRRGKSDADRVGRPRDAVTGRR
jgi:hypothetical protein